MRTKRDEISCVRLNPLQRNKYCIWKKSMLSKSIRSEVIKASYLVLCLNFKSIPIIIMFQANQLQTTFRLLNLWPSLQKYLLALAKTGIHLNKTVSNNVLPCCFSLRFTSSLDPHTATLSTFSTPPPFPSPLLSRGVSFLLFPLDLFHVQYFFFCFLAFY